MAKSVLELAVGTGQWDAGLKKAKNALDNFTQANGGLQSALNKDSKSMQTFVQMMGRMDSTAKTAKGQMNDYKGTIEQLTMQYNRLTDAQKKTIGQDYLRSIDQMKQKYQGVAQEVAKINQELKQTNEMSAGTGSGGGGLFSGDKLSGMLQVFGGNLMTKVAGMGVGFVSELGDMVKQGIELARAGEGIRIAFERLGRGDLLDGLREATHGTVTDLELMKAAVKFNDFKLPLDELGTMLAFAQQKAKDTGQSVDYMVDSIVTGLGRKSLMILDNLGLSAAEIKEKMAETGDMTKAVGAIIREQMAKAGDYVETAADRATQANVAMQNKMEELGQKFLPVKQASDDLWTSMKIGILDIVGGPLANLLNGLTRAGQLRNELKNIGSDERVNTDIDKLKGSNYKPQAYQMMLAKYSREEQKALDNYKKAQRGGMGSIAVWENRYLARKSMREDFQARGREIAYPTKINIKTDEAEQNVASLTQKLKELQAERKKAIAAGDTELSKNLLKQINQVKADIKGLGGNTTTTTTHKQPKTEIEQNQAKIKELTQEYIKLGDQETEASKNRQIEIQKEIELLQKRNNLLGVRTEQAQGKFLGGDVQTTGLSPAGYIIDRSRLFDTEGGIGWQKLQKYNDQTSVSEYKRRQKENAKEGKNEDDQKKTSEEQLQGIQTMIGSLQSIVGGINQLGIELPQELTDIFGVLQTITGIVGAIQSMQTVGTFLGIFHNGGLIGRAAGGMMIPGNSMSGDRLRLPVDGGRGMIGVNSGELILNRAQQGNLASQLQGGMGAMQLSAVITGEQLRLVLNNNGRRTGRGEYVTTNFR